MKQTADKLENARKADEYFLKGLKFMQGNEEERKMRAFGAYEYLEKAATHYELAGNWSHAGNSYECAAKSILLLREFEAADAYVHAGACFARDDMDVASTMYAIGIALFRDVGRPDLATNYEVELANAIEQDTVRAESCLQEYKGYAELYDTQAELTDAMFCWLNVGFQQIKLKRFREAAATLQTLLSNPCKKALLEYHNIACWFYVCICYIAIDDFTTVMDMLQKLDEDRPVRAGMKGRRFIRDLHEAVKANSCMAASKCVQEFVATTETDEWCQNVLNHVVSKMRVQQEAQK